MKTKGILLAGLMLIFVSAMTASAAVYTLTLNTNGSGTVSRNPTNSVYPDGAVVTITAAPSSGWMFVNWSGDASGSDNPLNVMMDANKIITAHFQLIPTYSLNVSTNGNGIVTLDPPNGPYLSNSTVSATATAASGWVFTGWLGDASGTQNPLSVTLNSNKSIAAAFAQLPAVQTPPQNTSSSVGGGASFNIQAVGTGTLFYQWWFGGAPLSGETGSGLTLSNLQPTQEGTYTVVVTNLYGTTNASATLTLTNSCSGTNVVSSPTEAELRAAISAGGLVRICCNGTITLTNTIEITHDVALDATDRNVIISGNNAVRLFKVSPGVTFAVTNLALANGRHAGSNGVPAGAQAATPGMPGQGGAIFNEGGTVVLASVTLTNNSAVGGDGANGNQNYPADGSPADGSGGAIYNQGGNLLLLSANIKSNWVSGGDLLDLPHVGAKGLGGAIYNTNGTVLIMNSCVESNACRGRMGGGQAWGGALFQASGSVTISNSLVRSNLCQGDAAGLDFSPAGNAYGGAIAVDTGTLTLSNNNFESNVARGGNGFRAAKTGEGHGGAIFSKATVLAYDNRFSGNVASAGTSVQSPAAGTHGGAFYNSGLAVINRCSFSSNYVVASAGGNAGMTSSAPGGHGLGGAIFNFNQMALTNCTLAFNSAYGGAGGWPSGVPGTGAGGGLYNSNGIVTMASVTIATNSVAAGTGYIYQGLALGANIANTNGTLSLRNSLVAYGGTNGNAWGTIMDGGYNISSDGTANFNSGTSFNFTDPRLDPLGDYGGPTYTMALRSNSPAIDFGDNSLVLSVDQRGFPRPVGGMDMGAYEFGSSPSPRPQLSVSQSGNNVQLAFQASPGTSYHIESSTNLLHWMEVDIIGPFANATNVTRLFNSTGTNALFFRATIP